jgi:DNA-directed RNA polymerase subunit RPC12/RpoP
MEDKWTFLTMNCSTCHKHVEAFIKVFDEERWFTCPKCFTKIHKVWLRDRYSMRHGVTPTTVLYLSDSAIASSMRTEKYSEELLMGIAQREWPHYESFYKLQPKPRYNYDVSSWKKEPAARAASEKTNKGAVAEPLKEEQIILTTIKSKARLGTCAKSYTFTHADGHHMGFCHRCHQDVELIPKLHSGRVELRCSDRGHFIKQACKNEYRIAVPVA